MFMYFTLSTKAKMLNNIVKDNKVVLFVGKYVQSF